MDSHELFAQRTFTIILHANDPYHVRLLEVPETEPFDKFLIRLQSFSKAAARQIFPLDERKYGLAGADGYWWFALINERGVPQPGRMIMRSERPYIWMKGRLLARDTRWKAALFRNVGPPLPRSSPLPRLCTNKKTLISRNSNVKIPSSTTSSVLQQRRR